MTKLAVLYCSTSMPRVDPARRHSLVFVTLSLQPRPEVASAIWVSTARRALWVINYDRPCERYNLLSRAKVSLSFALHWHPRGAAVLLQKGQFIISGCSTTRYLRLTITRGTLLTAHHGDLSFVLASTIVHSLSLSLSLRVCFVPSARYSSFCINLYMLGRKVCYCNTRAIRFALMTVGKRILCRGSTCYLSIAYMSKGLFH